MTGRPPRLGRPPIGDARRSIRIIVRLSPAELVELDAERGEVSRAEWLRNGREEAPYQHDWSKDREECPTCKGSGLDHGYHGCDADGQRSCPDCKGRGCK